ncbi:MAG: enoyl-ACP reductase [Thermaerobacter sp.]|nr:enoyl-ACP reductase [Thermaerobacter sp.]
MGLLEGQMALVTGIANKRSIGWGIAKAFDREGATLAVTYQSPRLKENLDRLLPELSRPPLVFPLDVTDSESLKELRDVLTREWGRLHTLVHSIAHANTEDLSGRFLDTEREGYLMALDISAYSLTALTRELHALLVAAGGGSVLTMTYQGSVRVIPNYNVMGVAKAALESSVRYLAWDLGKDRIRVNAVSAGPIKTLAASGVKGISDALHAIEERAPIPEKISPDDVGNAAAFLASDWARHITGHVLYVDSGFHIMGF